jgi:PD-(D/E)XK nuclease superfamily
MRTRNLFDPASNKPFTLSRSRFENFLNCPRCFYIDRRLGVEPPGGPPFTINSAVDHLLKKEFDHCRVLGEPHPYMVEAGIDAIPYADSRLDDWRENFKGVRVIHEASGFELTGAVDDLWIDRSTQELIVVDYKATAKDSEITLDADWQIGYKRQMEFYQWLMRKTGFKVSNTGYFVYCNGDRSVEGFGGVVKFKVKIIPYVGDDSWIEKELLMARNCLLADVPPESTEGCKQCAYVMDLQRLIPKE